MLTRLRANVLKDNKRKRMLTKNRQRLNGCESGEGMEHLQAKEVCWLVTANKESTKQQ